MGDHDWSDMDDSGIRFFLENNYNITTVYKIEDAKTWYLIRINIILSEITLMAWNGKAEKGGNIVYRLSGG